MSLINRRLGDRRWGWVTEFPLNDCAGVLVLYDRRSGSERRKTKLSVDDVHKLFSGFPAIESKLLKHFSEKGCNTQSLERKTLCLGG